MPAASEAQGSLRDRQVAESSLAPALRAGGAPVFALTEMAADATLVSLGKLVRAAPRRAAPFRSALQLLAFSDEPQNPEMSRDGEPLRKRFSRVRDRIMRDAADVETMDFATQHGAGNRVKRLRYVAVFLARLYGPRDVADRLKSVKRAQEALERHVDLLTAARHFKAMAVTQPACWFAGG